MASAVDEISSILGIPAEGVIEEDDLKSPEQCQVSRVVHLTFQVLSQLFIVPIPTVVVLHKRYWS